MKTMKHLCILAALAAVAQGDELNFTAGDTFLAPAPMGTTDDYLGVGLTPDLKTIAPDGSALPRAYPHEVVTATENNYRFEYKALESLLDVKANANYLGISGKVSANVQRRVLVIHGYHVAKVVKLKLPPGVAAAGPGVVTPVEIWYGWMASVVIEGDKQKFTGEVKAKFMQKGCEVEGLAHSNSLTTQTRVRGLQKRSGEEASLIMSSPQNLLSHFDKSAEPSPIFVRYMHTKPLSVAAIQWADKPTFHAGQFKLTVLEFQIAEKNRATNKGWDAFNGKPDPIVTAIVSQLKPGKEEAVEGGQTIMVSPVEENTLTPSVRLNPQTFWMQADTRSVLLIGARDKDLRNPDEIGQLDGQINLYAVPEFPIELDLSGRCKGSIEKLRIRIERVE